jgi:hypothetical protein
MKKHYKIFIFFCFCIIGLNSISCLATEPDWNDLFQRADGYFWRELKNTGPIVPTMFIVGYMRDRTIMMTLINGIQKIHAQEMKKTETVKTDLKMTPPPNFTYGQYVEGIDEFYSDYRNTTFKIEIAIAYVTASLNGISENELKSWLETLRQPKTEN